MPQVPEQVLVVRLPVVRVEVRCPPPPNAAVPRSGAFIVDIHDLRVDNLEPPVGVTLRDVNFADEPVGSPAKRGKLVMAVHWRRTVVAHAAAGGAHELSGIIRS